MGRAKILQKLTVREIAVEFLLLHPQLVSHPSSHKFDTMSESELSTYQLQLQQVEAALTSDPANSELLKLKTDLEQVINLTKTLIEQQVAKSNEDEEEEETAPSSSSGSGTKRKFHEEFTPVKHWQVGEQCQALWRKDGNYYEATVSEITTD